MRLFVALRVPSPVLQHLAETAAALRAELPPARWVPVANLHLTLMFLGEIAADRVEGLGEALTRCFASRGPFQLRLRDGGCFPPRRPARVAWVGFEPAPELEELQTAVAGALTDRLDLAAERRRFHPHLTLARPRRPWPRAAAEAWRRAFAGTQGPAFEVTEGHLMRSRLDPGGARHESLGLYPLSAADGDGV